ncbi:hypothetical protein D3C87_650720 [compost metagenome]
MRRVGFALVTVILTFTASSAAISPKDQQRIEELTGRPLELVERPKPQPYRALLMLGIGFGIGVSASALYSAIVRRRIDK